MNFKKNIKWLIAGGISFFVYCCTPLIKPPAETDTQVAQQHWSDASYTQLKQGYSIYIKKCGSCHYLHRPSKYSEEKWKKKIPIMGKKAKLDSLQTQSILRYVLTTKETNSFSRK